MADTLMRVGVWMPFCFVQLMANGQLTGWLISLTCARRYRECFTPVAWCQNNPP
jgi:hypothetical protein